MAVKRRRHREEVEVQILAAIHSFWDERGYPPTYREIGSRIGVAHSAVHGHIRNLSEAGLVYEAPNIARSLRLAPAGRDRLAGAAGVLANTVEPSSV